MAKLIYSGITSLDGYVADKEGKFDWAAPDPQIHAFINDMERTVGTYLYGRKMYEVMSFWESIRPEDELPDHELEYARIWQATDKIVYSRTLTEPASAKTRILREFDPVGVRRMTAESDRDISIGGAELAAVALKAGIVDECQLYIWPVVVGGGKPFFPDDVFLKFELAEQRRFDNGVVLLRYAAV